MYPSVAKVTNLTNETSVASIASVTGACFEVRTSLLRIYI